MQIALFTLLFISAVGVMGIIFPELLKKPREAIITSGMLLLSYTLTFLYLSDIMNITIDKVLESVFAAIAYPIRLLSR